jgi:hypothetical protein
VRSGTYANTNFGTDPTMIVKSDLGNYARKAYVKFSFSRFLEPSASNAKMRIYVDSIGADSPRTIKIYGTSDESWTETGITWNNAPAGAAWKEIDVTSYVNSNMSDKIVSFLLYLF